MSSDHHYKNIGRKEHNILYTFLSLDLSASLTKSFDLLLLYTVIPLENPVLAVMTFSNPSTSSGYFPVALHLETYDLLVSESDLSIFSTVNQVFNNQYC